MKEYKGTVVQVQGPVVDVQFPHGALPSIRDTVSLEVDGSKVTTLSGYSSALMQLAEGDEIRIRGQRQGTGGYVDITFRVTVGSKG